MSDLMHIAGHGTTECHPRTAGMCCMSRSHMSGSACYALHAVTDSVAGQQACHLWCKATWVCEGPACQSRLHPPHTVSPINQIHTVLGTFLHEIIFVQFHALHAGNDLVSSQSSMLDVVSCHVWLGNIPYMGAWDRDRDRKVWDSDRTVTCKTVQQYMGPVVLQKRLI